MRLISLAILFFTLDFAVAQSLISWSPTISVASNQFSNMHPRVVVDGSQNPLILWGNTNAKQAVFARWAGNGFSSPVTINPPSIPIFAASWAGPDIASHGDTVYVIFKETPEDDSGIYIIRSFDGGNSFLDVERIDAIGDSISRFPAIGTDAVGNPLVAFMKFDPDWDNARYVLARSNDFGATFEIDKLASKFSGGKVCDCCPAALTSYENTVAVLYRDNLDDLRNSWAGISFDGGKNIAGGLQIDDTDWMISACPSSGPDGIILGDSLYAVFMSAASGKTLCYRSRSSLNNLQLSSLEPLTGNIAGLGQQNFPRIAGSGNAAAIAWVQTVSGSSQLALQFTNNLTRGFSAGYEVLIGSNAVNADLALTSDGRIYVVWEDQGSGTVKFKSGNFTLSSAGSPVVAPNQIQVFPNPAADGAFNIQFEKPSEQESSFQIIDFSGKTVQAGNLPTNIKTSSIDASALPTGIYLVRIQGSDWELAKTVIMD